MFKIVALFILYLGSLLASNDGLVVNGVDLRTGKLTANLPALNYQFDDLGRVAVITDGSFETLFIYDSLATTVDYNDSKKDIYTFNDTGLLKTISQFVKNEGEDWLYYRGERVYWSSDESPRIKARLLQSSLNGYEVGYFFSYNSDGSLSEEKIAGNLSGESKQLIEVDEDGQFLENGAEFYTVSYSYDQQNPSLITQKKELDGYSIDYEYDFSGKFCTLKTFGSQHHSIFSYRYFFHDQGMLAKIVEESRENGAHYEKILEVDETFLSDSIAKSQTAKKVTTSSLPFGLSQQSLEDQHGNLMVHNFDALGRLIEIVKPAVIDASGIVYHPTYHFSYNYLDQLVSSTDPKQQTTRYEYNIRGELTKVYYPDGTFENCTYYLNGLVKSRRLRDGTAENFYYDDCRRLTQQLKFSSQNQLLENITFEYSGNLKLKQTVAGTNCTVYLYDEKGALIGYEVYDAAGALVLKDGATNLEQEERQGLPAQNMTDSIVVDETGQSVLQQLLLTNDGCQKVFLYDSRQNIVKEELLSPSGELIFQKRNLYDENGLKIAEINAKIIDGQLDSYYKIDWEYDAAANLTSVSEGGSCLQYIYDDLGRLSQLVQPSGVSINYIYNDLDKISQIYSSDETVNYLYEYEADGQIMLVTDLVNQKSQIYQYDCLHRLVEFKDDDMVVAQQYDLDGNLIKLGLPDGSQITYEYVDQRLTLLSRLSATQTELYRQTYQYLGSSNLPSSYEMINELGAVDLKYLGKKLVETTSSWFSQKMQLERGLKPKIEAISTSFSGRHNSIFPKFGAQGELTSAGAETYTYDSLGNMLSASENIYKVNLQNQVVETGDTHCEYDLNGNLIRKTSLGSEQLFSYDALNRLKSFEKPQELLIEYIYSGQNQRLEEIHHLYDSGRKSYVESARYRYIYDRGYEVGKIDQNGNITQLKSALNGSGMATAAIEVNGQIYAPLEDLNGSIRGLIETNSGQLKEIYEYDSFGDELKLENSLSPWKYAGKRKDVGSNLIFYGARYYDPSLKRWTTKDPCQFYDGPNLYRFVKNNPLIYFDQNGQFSVSSIWQQSKDLLNQSITSIIKGAQSLKKAVKPYFALPENISSAIEKIGSPLIGDKLNLLFGYVTSNSHSGSYGDKESELVRITFINGILSTDEMLEENLQFISETHGGVKVHYVFRGTRGWTGDISQAIIMRTCYLVGYRSEYAYELASLWKELIEEMGGADSKGVIIHYAHSLGGCDTDRARSLLTEEEQKMIKVYTFGSATMIRNVGFKEVVNIVSANDGVSSILLEPLGRIRNFFDPNTNVRVYGTFSFIKCQSDHLLKGETYMPLLTELGQRFQDEFGV